jgi:hypothetical protein
MNGASEEPQNSGTNGSGFRKISYENWRSADPIFETGVFRLDEKTWLERTMEPKLDPSIPRVIAELFEIARGCIAYGWCFYPLLTLGSEQMLRIMDTAIELRCKQLELPAANYEKNIDTLIKAGVIPAEHKVRWHAGRRLRNFRSHPKDMMIMMPGEAIGQIELTAEWINGIFRAEGTITPSN